MAKRLSKILSNSHCACMEGVATIFLIIFIILSTSSIMAQQVSSPCLEPAQAVEVAGVKFLAPPCYKLEQASDSRATFLREPENQLALFVVVTDQEVDDNYLINLSNNLAFQFLPQQNGFTWKLLWQNSERKVSKYQTNRLTAKGINGKKFVQTDYVMLKAQGHNVVVGSIATFGNGLDAKLLFDVEGREYSIAGWQGLFQLIASVTGERDR